METVTGPFLGFAAVIALGCLLVGLVELRRRFRRASRTIREARDFQQSRHVRVIDLDLERSVRKHPAGQKRAVR